MTEWKRMSLEVTDEMRIIADDIGDGFELTSEQVILIYQAMVAATPDPPDDELVRLRAKLARVKALPTFDFAVVDVHSVSGATVMKKFVALVNLEAALQDEPK